MMVALLVMPFAIYMEVMGGMWYLGSTLCDAWIAIDVIACTASILNLTAISVDRFVPVDLDLVVCPVDIRYLAHVDDLGIVTSDVHNEVAYRKLQAVELIPSRNRLWRFSAGALF